MCTPQLAETLALVKRACIPPAAPLACEEAVYRLVSGRGQLEDGPGLAFRLTTELQEKDAEIVKWGSSVRGRDLGNGWIQVGDRFLPMAIEGRSLLVRCEAEKGATCGCWQKIRQAGARRQPSSSGDAEVTISKLQEQAQSKTRECARLEAMLQSMGKEGEFLRQRSTDSEARVAELEKELRQRGEGPAQQSTAADLTIQKLRQHTEKKTRECAQLAKMLSAMGQAAESEKTALLQSVEAAEARRQELEGRATQLEQQVLLLEKAAGAEQGTLLQTVGDAEARRKELEVLQSVEAAEARRQELEGRATQLEQQVTSLEQAAQAEKAAVLQSIEAAEALRLELEGRASQLEQRATSLEEAADGKPKSMEAAEARSQQLEERNAQLEQEVRTALQAAEAEKAALLKSVEAAEARRRELEGRVAQLEQEVCSAVQAAEAERAALLESVEAADARRRELEGRAVQLEQRMAAAEQAVEVGKSALLQSIEAADGRRRELEGRALQLEQRTASVEQLVEADHQVLETAEAHCRELGGRAAQLERQLTSLEVPLPPALVAAEDAGKKSLQSCVAEAEMNVETLLEALARAKQEKEEAQTQVRVLQAKVDSQGEKIMDLEAEVMNMDRTDLELADERLRQAEVLQDRLGGLSKGLPTADQVPLGADLRALCDLLRASLAESQKEGQRFRQCSAESQARVEELEAQIWQGQEASRSLAQLREEAARKARESARLAEELALMQQKDRFLRQRSAESEAKVAELEALMLYRQPEFPLEAGDQALVEKLRQQISKKARECSQLAGELTVAGAFRQRCGDFEAKVAELEKLLRGKESEASQLQSQAEVKARQNAQLVARLAAMEGQGRLAVQH